MTDREGQLLGDVVYFSVNYMAGYEIGYAVYDPARRGTGVMREALPMVIRNLFETRNVHRLQIATAPDNAASQALALSCGFQLEGRLRGHLFLSGRYEDSLLYALLRDDWATRAIG